MIAARAVLGLAAAVIMPLALAVVPVMFTPDERPRAIAIVGGATFIGYPLGPILGGWLLDHFWWGSVFLINVPIVIIAMLAVAFLMPESRGQGKLRLDVAGVLISSAGLVALTYGVIKAGQDGWSDTLAVVTMVAGAILLAAFVGWERVVTRRRATACGPGPVPVGRLHLGNDAGHDDLIRAVRSHLRDAAVLPRRARVQLAGQRRPDAAAHRRAGHRPGPRAAPADPA